MLTKIIIFFYILNLLNTQFVNAKSCVTLLKELSETQKLFLQCVTKNSVPVKMCQGCKNEYDDNLHAYDLLSSNCNTTYFDQDRINLVPFTESILTNLWTKGYCNDCFNNNNSEVFQEKFTAYSDCVSIYKNKSCDNCKNQYMDLNSFYISLDRQNNGEVCFDLQDSMNRTRYQWSKVFRCCIREYNTLYFSIALGIITCLPFIFYYSTYLLTKRRERSHGILNDEDPVFNSASPSSSSAIAHLNISNNSVPNNQSTTNELNTNSSTSVNVDNKKISKAKDQDFDSSDEELIIKDSIAKEKLK